MVNSIVDVDDRTKVVVTGSVTWSSLLPGRQTFAELRQIHGSLQTVAAALKRSLVSDEVSSEVIVNI